MEQGQEPQSGNQDFSELIAAVLLGGYLTSHLTSLGLCFLMCKMKSLVQIVAQNPSRFKSVTLSLLLFLDEGTCWEKLLPL